MISERNRTMVLLLATALAPPLVGCGGLDDAWKAASAVSKADGAAEAAAKGTDVAAGQKATRAIEGEEAPAIAEEVATEVGEQGVEMVLEAGEDRSDADSTH